jgi:hypothetical protein|tara:strand:+ start:2291 stop:2908 length:618 start_codon:yes stop_codon:yes gene_type:complete
MAKPIKHTGKMKNTGNRVAVVFRTVPGESDKCLVIDSATLPDMYHDSLMTAIETDQAQQSFELGEYMFRGRFPDGKNMLEAMQQSGRMHKVATSDVVMTPTTNESVVLSELNALIAEQRNVAVDQLYTFVSGAPQAGQAVADTPTPAPEAPQVTEGALSDSDLAKSYRSQADAMYKEAAQLRRQADELDPPAKKTTKKAKVAESA